MLFVRLFMFAILGALPGAAPPASAVPRGVYLGQDGLDYCQTASALGPNDIQDLHVRLEGLPPDDEIDSAVITRHGGGQWTVNDRSRSWRGKLVRDPGSTRADIFLEPSHDEPNFRLDFELRFHSGKTNRFPVPGGRSNPNLFMPRAMLAATWVGQEGPDWTGPGPAVGPDGFEDVRIEVTGLSTNLEIKSLVLELSSGQPGGGAGGWEYGLNPRRWSNAELIRSKADRSHGSFYFSPDRDLSGQKLVLRATYKIERSNATAVIAGPVLPRRAMPRPAEIKLTPARLEINWLGQDGKEVPSRGDAHVSLNGLPPSRQVLAAALSDVMGGFWVYRRDAKVDFHPRPGDSPHVLPLASQRTEGSTQAELFFPPYRDETNTRMTLRLLLDDGSTLVQPFIGASCNPFLRGPVPQPERIEAKPGDDLNAVAGQFGLVRLAPGTYTLAKPLVLKRPVTIEGSPGSVLSFRQEPDEPAWNGAILIGASHVTLHGFAVRFSHNFRWSIDAPGGAGIIRSFDRPGNPDPKFGITLSQLDVESSSVAPPAEPARPTEAPYLVRLAGAISGRIIGNRFRGGTVDVGNGPWQVTDNTHEGAMPGTVAWDAFGGHWLHDFTLERNRVTARPDSGKIWRFISMNQIGNRVEIRDNDVSGVGMRDNDVIPNPNAPEILLTESYRLYFEGKPSSVSSDGRVVQIPMVMHETVRPGSVISILSGEHAGRHCVVAQPLTSTAFLLDEPLPAGDYAISVAHGFRDLVLERNRIDVRGGSSALVVLAGNHWNLRMLNNHLLGGGDSLLLQSTPTEDPFIWGWSHTPFLDFLCEGNVHEDSLRGVSIDVFSNRHNKTSAGRTYLSGIYRNNTVRWSEAVARHPKRNLDPIRIGGHSDPRPEQWKVVSTGNKLPQ